MPTTWKIDAAEPALLTMREQQLHSVLGCRSSSETRHVTGMTAYAVIHAGWWREFPAEPMLDVLALALAGAEQSGWPDSAAATFGIATHSEPSRRPDAARAPSITLRSASTERVAV